MTPERIFEDKVRTDTSFAKHLDDIFDFYDRSAKPEFKLVRDTINNWFKDYPDSEKIELKARFKKTFSPAFFELFIYQLFTKQGFSLTPHPALIGTTKKPDFLAEKEGISFYIEAKEATDASEIEIASSKKVNTVYDAISQIETPNFWLNVSKVALKTSKQPSGKRIIRSIEKQLITYDLETIEAQMRLPEWSDTEHIIIDNDEVFISIKLFPKSEEIRGDRGIPSIGMYPIESFWGGPDNSIRTSIHKKASKYGQLDKPYLICINAFSNGGITTFGVEEALLGSLSYTWSSNPNDRDARLERVKNGVFLSQTGPKMTRVSGIFVTSVFPSNVHNAAHWLMKHPYAKRELDFDKMDLSYQHLVGRHWQNMLGKTVGEILE